MNLEDFKSFRRVLKPSEVGSIPTHSRQVVLAVLLGVLWGQAPAGAQEEGSGPSPINRAIRSALVPAWGQLTNGKEVKAVALFGVQSYIWTRVVLETRDGRAAERRADRLWDEGAPLPEIAVERRSAEDHFSTRRDLLFWAIFAGMYGALDAYIDAHLGEFDEELEEGRELFAGVDARSGGLALGYRF